MFKCPFIQIAFFSIAGDKLLKKSKLSPTTDDTPVPDCKVLMIHMVANQIKVPLLLTNHRL